VPDRSNWARPRRMAGAPDGFGDWLELSSRCRRRYPGSPGEGPRRMGIFPSVGAAFVLEGWRGVRSGRVRRGGERPPAPDGRGARAGRLTRHVVWAVTIASFIRASRSSAGLDVEALAFFSSPRIIARCSSAAPADDLQCRLDILDFVPRRKPPRDRFLTSGVSYSQTSTTRRVACGGAARTLMLAGSHLTEASFEFGGPRLALAEPGFAEPGFQRQPEAANYRPFVVQSSALLIVYLAWFPASKTKR
jgi:hypothetical protein